MRDENTNYEGNNVVKLKTCPSRDNKNPEAKKVG